jgi:hypothetical protein
MHQPLAYVQFEWLNLNLALARERFPNREPCGEFFPCAGFALDQNRGIRRSNLFHLVQHRQQGRAGAGDFFEVVVGANFLLQINVFLFQAGLQSLDFLVGHHVGDGQRHLIGHFLQKLHVNFGVLALLPAADADCADALASDDQGPKGIHATPAANAALNSKVPYKEK